MILLIGRSHKASPKASLFGWTPFQIEPAFTLAQVKSIFFIFGLTCSYLVFSKDLGVDTAAVLKSSNQIIARSGDVITGKSISNPNGPCIVLNQVKHVTITGNQIGPCGSDPRYEVGITLHQSSDIQIISNTFKTVSSALYATSNSNDAANNGKLLFEGNQATEIRGPAPRGQLVQLNQYSGPNIVIRCNVSDQAIGGYINKDGSGGPEDHINIYKSSGTLNSPIQILNNKLRGGGSKSGGGILAVDGGNGANVMIEGNILVDAGQYGVGIPAGENITVKRNRIFASTHAWTNVGIYVWNQYAGTACSRTEISGNQVNYRNQKGMPNPYWNSGNCGKVSIMEPNHLQDHSITAAIWNESPATCKTSWRTW